MVWMPIDCWLTKRTYTILYNHNQSWHTLTSHVIPIPNEGPLNERPACLSRMTSSAFARMAISTRSWPTVLPSTDPRQKQVKQHAKTPRCWQILQARSFVSRLQEFSCLKPHSSNSIALTPNYRNTEYSSGPKEQDNPSPMVLSLVSIFCLTSARCFVQDRSSPTWRFRFGLLPNHLINHLAIEISGTEQDCKI